WVGVDAARVAVGERELAPAADVEGRAGGGDGAAVVDGAGEDVELAAGVRGEWHGEVAVVRARALLDRAGVDDGGGAGGAVEIDGGVALQVDGAVVRQHGVVLHVDVVGAGDVDRAGVRDGAGVEVGGAADGECGVAG